MALKKTTSRKSRTGGPKTTTNKPSEPTVVQTEQIPPEESAMEVQETQAEVPEPFQNAQENTAPDNVIRKKAIYDHVTATTGLRKREVREAVDATLAYFHSCLTEGKDLQIPPMGKIRTITRGEGENSKRIHKLILQKAKSDEKKLEEAKETLANPENAD